MERNKGATRSVSPRSFAVPSKAAGQWSLLRSHTLRHLAAAEGLHKNDMRPTIDSALVLSAPTPSRAVPNKPQRKMLSCKTGCSEVPITNPTT